MSSDGGGEGASGKGGGNGGDRGLGKARVRLELIDKLRACGEGSENPCLLMLSIEFWWDSSE